ncbi:MAG: hypothetical protein A2163_08005 [Actinobacteria bacterium RBG_13_35_12]|nr:MAG: hypothetical protein A2163_08005 [Actinobacteria bacterium RBG_13_35_12]
MKKIRSTKKECDDLFREVIRNRYNSICQNCNSKYHPQVAHFISRGYYTTRWDINNACILCQRCHLRFTFKPLEWELWVVKRIGEAEYKQLKQKALAYQKIFYPDIMNDLIGQLELLHT